MLLSQSVQNLKPSYIREILSAATSDNVISLAGGLPSEPHLPIKYMADAIHSLVDNRNLFQYGKTAGYDPLIEFLTSYYQVSAEHSSVICSGSQQGLDLVARTLLNKGEVVVLEAPSYVGALQVFGLAQANIINVTHTHKGPDLNQLESIFSSQKVKVFYAVPDFHNPTGSCWSLDTRVQVAKLCQRYQVLLIEDAPYRELRFSGEQLPMVSSLCPEISFVLRSFSKVATPGIRLGMLTGPQKYIEHLVKVKQTADLHTSVPMQYVLLHMLQDQDFETHLTELKALYRARYRTMDKCIKQLFINVGHCDEVQGGMFIWLKLFANNAQELSKKALQNGVAVVPSAAFYQSEQLKQPALRLNFSNTSEDNIVKAMSILADIAVGE